jgi:hypothetical protein
MVVDRTLVVEGTGRRNMAGMIERKGSVGSRRCPQPDRDDDAD